MKDLVFYGKQHCGNQSWWETQAKDGERREESFSLQSTSSRLKTEDSLIQFLSFLLLGLPYSSPFHRELLFTLWKEAAQTVIKRLNLLLKSWESMGYVVTWNAPVIHRVVVYLVSHVHRRRASPFWTVCNPPFPWGLSGCCLWPLSLRKRRQDRNSCHATGKG